MANRLLPKPAVTSLLHALELAAASGHGIRVLEREERVQWFSYQELHTRAAGVAGALQEAGIQPGQRIALLFTTGVHFYDAFMGTLWAGAIPSTLPPPSPLGDFEEYQARTAAMLAMADVSLVLTTQAHLPRVEAVVAACLPHVACQAIESLSLRAIPPHPATLHETALIQFSSGTVQTPKPIELTHGNLLSNAEAILAALRPVLEASGEELSGVCWLPLYHDMGLIGCVIASLLQPCNMTYLSPETFVLSPALWLRTISRYQATISPAPHFAYAYCAARIREVELEGVDLSCWRFALNGGEFISAKTLTEFVQRFERYGLSPSAVSPVYGLAEATLAVTFSDLRRPFAWRCFEREALALGQAVPTATGVPLVSVGTPLKDCIVRIVGPDGQGLPEGVLGRVEVKGPGVMKGYFKAPAGSALTAGWLDTGDRGFLLEGELYLYGRTKELIILNGRNHSPQVVEAVVEALRGEAGTCIAFGWGPEAGQAERLALLVERGKQASLSEDRSLAQTLLKRVSEKARLIPQDIYVVPRGTLPRTSSGKIRRLEAQRRLAAGTLTAQDDITHYSNP